MSEILKVLNRKVELKSEVVELFDLVDLMGISKNINSRIKDIDSTFKKYVTSKDSLENEMVPLNLDIQKAEKAEKEISLKIKELGLSSKQVPELKVIQTAIKEANKTISEVKQEL